jgi:phospholipid/cholesterol/gamma-HCH transport system substrate-binding protein
MKLPIRFADKIVGAFLILALGILVFVIFMLGSSQRWFARDYYFKTYFDSASGLSRNMAVQYKGFTIGHIKTFDLMKDDRVEVIFTVFDTHIDKVVEGSLVELQTSPLAALGGNSFLFHPGLGADRINERETIYPVGSPEAQKLLDSGKARLPTSGDSIGSIIGSVEAILSDLSAALKGTDETSLGRIVGSAEGTLTNVEQMVQGLSGDIEDILGKISAQIEPILGDVKGLSGQIADPDGSIVSVLDSISGIMQSLDRTAEFIPSNLPQVGAILSNVYVILQQVQDTLTAVNNNPLLKGGVPERKETPAGGTRSRDAEF